MPATDTASTFVKTSEKGRRAARVPFNFRRLISLTISIISRAIKCGVIRSRRDARARARAQEPSRARSRRHPAGTENSDFNRDGRKSRKGRGGAEEERKGCICNCKSIKRYTWREAYPPYATGGRVKNISAGRRGIAPRRPRVIYPARTFFRIGEVRGRPAGRTAGLPRSLLSSLFIFA